MQCFGGCFAAQNGTRNDNAFPSPHTKKQAACSAGPAWANDDEQNKKCLQPSQDRTAAQGNKARTSLKAKLRRLSNSSSFIGQSEDSTSSSTSSSYEAVVVEDPQQLRQTLQQHGRHIMAVSTLQQEGLQHFVMPGVGYIAYGLMHNGPEFLNALTAVVLADPICAVQHYRVMAEAFLKQHPKAMFAQVSAEFAAVLQDFGFTVNSMGGETRLDIATYNFSGYARRGLRSAITSATKEGIVVEEVMQPPGESLGAGAAAALSAVTADNNAAGTGAGLVAEMLEVDRKWAAVKAGRVDEVWFINRRPIFAPEPGVRKFIARNAAGQLQGYIFFDGVFEDGQLVGYYANVTRMLPDAHPGTLNLMVKVFIERVRSEAQLAAPAKKLSVRRSLRKKQAAAAAAAVTSTSAAAAVAAAGADVVSTPAGTRDQQFDAAAPAKPQFLSLGLSPFYQMDSGRFNSCSTTSKLLQMTYDSGECFYPFKTLAAAKAKYGAGLHDGKYEDAAVEYRQAYLCHRRGGEAMVSVFDLGKFFGLWRHPADFFGRYLGHKVKRSISKKKQQGDTSALRKSRSSGGGSCASGASDLAGHSKSSSTALSRPGSRSKSCPLVVADATCSNQAGSTTTTKLQQQQQQQHKTAKAALSAGAAAAGGTAAAAAAARASDTSLSASQSLIGTAANPPAADSSASEGGSDIVSCQSGTSSTAPSSVFGSCSSGSTSGSSSGGGSGSGTPTKMITDSNSSSFGRA